MALRTRVQQFITNLKALNASDLFALRQALFNNLERRFRPHLATLKVGKATWIGNGWLDERGDAIPSTHVVRRVFSTGMTGGFDATDAKELAEYINRNPEGRNLWFGLVNASPAQVASTGLVTRRDDPTLSVPNTGGGTPVGGGGDSGAGGE